MDGPRTAQDRVRCRDAAQLRETRVVHTAGIVHEPDGRWIMQVGRNLLDALDGFLLRKTHLILDGDPVFTPQFRRLLGDSGVKPVRLPARSPNLNAYAERFVGSLRRECLDKVVLPFMSPTLSRTQNS